MSATRGRHQAPPRVAPRWMTNTGWGAGAAVLALFTVLALLGGTGAAATLLGERGPGLLTGLEARSAHTAPAAHALATSPVARVTVDAALARVRSVEAAQPSGGVSVAVTDLSTGQRLTAGATHGMRTASVYKLFVLETLLRRSGGPLTGSQDALATKMIEDSDNDAGYSLYLAAGGCSALKRMAHTLHMTHTVIGCTDPTFTTTSGADFLLALAAITGPGTLTRSARSYAKHLMAHVTAGQRWGVGVVADKGATFYNKNGWLSIDDTNPPGDRDNDLWAVNSVGIVPVHGHSLLMAVFTQHQDSMADGVTLVQRLAKIIGTVATA